MTIHSLRGNEAELSNCFSINIGVQADNRPNLVWGGGGTLLVCPTALLTRYTYTTLFEILSVSFLRIFPWGGVSFFEKGPFCDIIY